MFARSTVMGNAKASTSGTSNKYGSHAFFVLIIKCQRGKSGGTDNL